MDDGAREIDSALASLPIAHAVALRLRREGASDELIAAALDIELDELPTVLAIAEAKLAREVNTTDGEPPKGIGGRPG